MIARLTPVRCNAQQNKRSQKEGNQTADGRKALLFFGVMLDVYSAILATNHAFLYGRSLDLVGVNITMAGT